MHQRISLPLGTPFLPMTRRFDIFPFRFAMRSKIHLTFPLWWLEWISDQYNLAAVSKRRFVAYTLFLLSYTRSTPSALCAMHCLFFPHFLFFFFWVLKEWRYEMLHPTVVSRSDRFFFCGHDIIPLTTLHSGNWRCLPLLPVFFWASIDCIVFINF